MQEQLGKDRLISMYTQTLDATVPYSKPMEDYLLPSEDKIVRTVMSVLS
jgi:hypothetical protein